MLIEQRKSANDQPKHRCVNEPDNAFDKTFKIGAQPTALVKPRERALYHPPARKHLKRPVLGFMHDLHRPTAFLFGPLRERSAVVAGVGPQVLEARQFWPGLGQDLFGPGTVADAGRRHGEANGKSFSIDQKVALTPSHELSPVEPTFSARFGRLDRLAIENPGAGSRLPPFALSPAAVERPVDAFERSVGAPLAEVGVDSLVVGQVTGQVAPGAAVFGNVENRVDDFTKVHRARSAASALGWKQRLDQFPFRVGQVGGVGLSGHIGSSSVS